MPSPQGYPKPRRKSQGASWPLHRRLAWTWQGNPRYSSGRWCRSRRRREYWLAHWKARVFQYLRAAPRWAPYRRWEDWPQAGLALNRGAVYLPRQQWAQAEAAMRETRRLLRFVTEWLRVWRATGHLPPVIPLLGALFRSVPDGLPSSRDRPSAHSAAATRGS